MTLALIAAAAAVYFWPAGKEISVFGPAQKRSPQPAAVQPAAMLQRLIDVRGHLLQSGRLGEPEKKSIDVLALAVMAGGDE